MRGQIWYIAFLIGLMCINKPKKAGVDAIADC